MFDSWQVIALLKAAFCAFLADNKSKFWSDLIFNFFIYASVNYFDSLPSSVNMWTVVIVVIYL